MKPLNKKNIPAQPSYPVKVLQFGEGNFLRAFVDWVINRLNSETSFGGSVHIVQPLAGGMTAKINEQDNLYHVLLQGIKNGETVDTKSLITCINDATNPYDDYDQFLALGINPDLKFIISNTTEAGISFNADDTSAASLPASFPGKVTALLHHRFMHFKGDPDKGLFIIPCELIENNGITLKSIILKYAQLWQLSDDFIAWVNEHNTFCNTLVDRIVPGFPKEDIENIQQELGFEDNLVVKAEPFLLWVIDGPEKVQKAFPTNETDMDVVFVNDITPYRTRKVRILNGAHTSLVPVAYLHGLRTVKEAVEDDYTGKYIKEAIFEEIVPTLDLPQAELEKFANDVLERFQNPFVRHELITIALNSVSKYKVRVLPSVLEYYKRKGQLPHRLVHALAALILFYKGEYNGEIIPLKDDNEIIEFFKNQWANHTVEELVANVLSNTSLWDKDLNQVPGMATMVTRELNKLLSKTKEESKL